MCCSTCESSAQQLNAFHKSSMGSSFPIAKRAAQCWLRFAPLTLHDRTYFTEVRPRRSWKQPRGVTMPRSADKIRSDLAAGEEFQVDRVVVDTQRARADLG